MRPQEAYAQRQQEKGLKLVKVWVPKNERQALLNYAADLRGDPKKAPPWYNDLPVHSYVNNCCIQKTPKEHLDEGRGKWVVTTPEGYTFSGAGSHGYFSELWIAKEFCREIEPLNMEE